MEIRHRKRELLEKKVDELGEEDEVEYEEDVSNAGGGQKPRDGVTSMTSAGTWR